MFRGEGESLGRQDGRRRRRRRVGELHTHTHTHTHTFVWCGTFCNCQRNVTLMLEQRCCYFNYYKAHRLYICDGVEGHFVLDLKANECTELLRSTQQHLCRFENQTENKTKNTILHFRLETFQMQSNVYC